MPGRSPRLLSLVLLGGLAAGCHAHEPRNEQPEQRAQPVAEPAAEPAPTLAGSIAFVSARDGNLEIYRMNPDGRGLLRLTNNESYDGFPAWSSYRTYHRRSRRVGHAARR